MDFTTRTGEYTKHYLEIIKTAEVSFENEPTIIEDWYESVIRKLCETDTNKLMLYLIGNGASCSMAAHLAADFTKNGGLNAHSCSEGTLLTTFSNDFSYQTAYMEILKRFMKNGDILVAISSSGRSDNIINAARYARYELKNSSVITFSGFKRDNPLRLLGHYNLYVNSMDYGTVESAHGFFLHMLIDLFIEYKNNR